MTNFSNSEKINGAQDIPLRSFPGVGEKRLAAYEKLGIHTSSELLRHFPRAYQHRGLIKTLAEAKNGEICALLLTVGTQPQGSMLKKRLTITKFSAFDESGKCTVVFFNQNYIRDVFHVGETFRFWGKVTRKGSRIELGSPQFEPCLPGRPLPDFVSLYPLSAPLTQKLVYSAVGLALSYAAQDGVGEVLPHRVREKHGLVGAGEAYRMIHRPLDYSQIEMARRYFAFEELYVFLLAVALTKKNREISSKRARRIENADISPFLEALPFKLTSAQEQCVADITSDMTAEADGEDGTLNLPMSRLVSGDVGSGKTAVAAAAIYICLSNGLQAALMAPTEILAEQHYRELSPLFEQLGYECALLTGSTPARRKREIKERLRDGSLPFVIGTHALLTDDLHIKTLGLVVTDEQHRFGIMQRAALQARTDADFEPHMLVMSATPIPRTLALILYGDLDVSTIDTLPPGRQKVDTYCVGESYRARLNAFIRKNVDQGGQVYVVCPMVENRAEDELDCAGEIISFDRSEGGDTAPKSAVAYAAELKERVFPDLRTAFIHGKMKPSEKDRIMLSFARGEIDILVSTTVIEVGVNVPNASLMIVENAERFGLSQLHQLRGRVGRGERKSYCVLVSDAKSENAKARLSVMCQSNNGFEIASKDLELRGPGDFFPTEGSARQSGKISLGVASSYTDVSLIREAYEEAQLTVELDPKLESEENRAAAERLRVALDETGARMN